MYLFWWSCLKHFDYGTAWKINMEAQHGGLVQMMFLFNWVIFRFHVNFKGCIQAHHTPYIDRPLASV